MTGPTLAALGRLDGMPHADYLAVPAVSNSGFKALRKSPWHFHMLARQDAERPPKPPSPQMFAGTLMHCALLEPDTFPARFPIGPDVSKNSRAWRDFADGLLPDAQAVSAAQHDIAFAQAASLRTEEYVADLFARPGDNEVSIFWQDRATGLLCKARPDRVVPTHGGVILLDAKTAVDASRMGFARSVGSFFYDFQAAWYARGWRAACGEAVHGMVFGVVESEYPYAAAAYMLSDADLNKADSECTRLLAVLADCEAKQQWPAYPSGMSAPLELPAWVARVREEQAQN